MIYWTDNAEKIEEAMLFLHFCQRIDDVLATQPASDGTIENRFTKDNKPKMARRTQIIRPPLCPICMKLTWT